MLMPASLPMALIYPSNHGRTVQQDRVSVIAQSMAEIGLKTPISVRRAIRVRGGRDADVYEIVTGRHRYEAAVSLKWQEIDAVIIEGDERDARLWEIAENLHRAELNAVERAEHIDEWRRLTLGKVSQAETPSSGGNQPAERGYQKTAEALGVSKHTVSRAEKIAALPQETRDEAREEGWSQERLLAEARKRTVMRDEPAMTKADGPDMYVEAHKLAKKFSVGELQTLIDHLSDILKERL